MNWDTVTRNNVHVFDMDNIIYKAIHTHIIGLSCCATIMANMPFQYGTRCFIAFLSPKKYQITLKTKVSRTTWNSIIYTYKHFTRLFSIILAVVFFFFVFWWYIISHSIDKTKKSNFYSLFFPHENVALYWGFIYNEFIYGSQVIKNTYVNGTHFEDLHSWKSPSNDCIWSNASIYSMRIQCNSENSRIIYSLFRDMNSLFAVISNEVAPLSHLPISFQRRGSLSEEKKPNWR